MIAKMTKEEKIIMILNLLRNGNNQKMRYMTKEEEAKYEKILEKTYKPTGKNFFDY